MSRKALADCESVFFDTGPIIDSLRGGSTDTRHHLALQLLKHLSTTKTQNNRVRKFQMSAISISEISTLSNDFDLVKRLAQVLNVGNLEISSFDKTIALRLNQVFRGLLSRKQQNELAREINLHPGNLVTAREWITRDMMIATTALVKNADIVFTTDAKTFKPIAEKIGLFCVQLDESSFLKNQRDQPMMEFDPGKI